MLPDNPFAVASSCLWLNAAIAFSLNMVFNVDMQTISRNSMTDAERIKSLGGPAKVARLLGFSAAGGTQRVHNWMTRGIPSKVKVDNPKLFMAKKAA